MYFAGAVPYLRLKREGGALPYFTGAQLYLSGAETVEYSYIYWYDEKGIKMLLGRKSSLEYRRSLGIAS